MSRPARARGSEPLLLSAQGRCRRRSDDVLPQRLRVTPTRRRASAAAAAPSANAGAGPTSLPTSLALPTPLATSVPAGGGTWATVAMGDLGQPLNTFWQLLFRPAGTNSWSDRVEATAVATNGGLVLASARLAGGRRAPLQRPDVLTPDHDQ